MEQGSSWLILRLELLPSSNVEVLAIMFFTVTHNSHTLVKNESLKKIFLLKCK